MSCEIVVRVANLGDAPAIVRIYNQGIERRIATFETRLRTPEDIVGWFGDPRHPLLVVSQSPSGEGAGGEVLSSLSTREEWGEVAVPNILGWIHASEYRPRECYAGIGEFSVYIDEAAQGKGAGSALMAAFLPACTEAGLWKVLSRIFVENTSSRALCRKFGFREVGVYERHARLDGVWRDVVIVEKLLEENL